MVSAVWETPGNTSSIILTKNTGETIRLAVGDFITYSDRKGGVCIRSFTHINNETPIGMIYLPWRYEEKRWATVSFTLRGDERHIILPGGIRHYGEHIDLNSIEHCDTLPEGYFVEK